MNDKKMFDQELDQNANKYKAIVDHLTEGIVIVDENIRVTEWNAAMEAIVGIPRQEAEGRMYDEVVMEFIPAAKRSEAFRQVFRSGIEEMLRKGSIPESIMDGEIEILSRDGKKKFIRQTVFVIPAGEKFHIGSVTTDITKRKTWEEDLRQSEARYRLLFENAHDSIMLMEEDMFVDCNAKTLKTFECTREEFVGKSPWIFSPEFQPDGRSSMDTGRERIQFALGGISQTFEWIHITSRGRPFAAEVSLNAVTIEGRTYLQAIVRNVAKRKKSDDQLRKFSECLLSFGTDPVKNINLLTGLCGEIFGATSALYNRIVGTQLCAVGMWNTPDDYVPVSDPHGHICYDVINNNNAEVVVVENLPSTDYFHTDPNVAKYKLRTYVGKVVSFSGESAGSLCAVFQHDFHPDAADKYFISLIASAIGVEEARKDALDRLLENAADLQESNIAKDKFFSIIAHDLKSPFNAIMGFSDILTAEWNDFSEEERQHFIWNINSSAKNTFRLLENLLEWAMTQTGKLSYHPVPVDLSVIANEIIIIFREQAEKKQVRLYTAVNFGTIVSADENMVRTIFRNLVSNAIKFTEPGGHVRIFSEEVLSGQPQQKMVEVSVLDSGVGIEAHVLPLLFRIDEKVRSLGTAQEKGTGLGLLLCRELIEKNRGTIHAENGPEKGSRFYFTLPAGE